MASKAQYLVIAKVGEEKVELPLESKKIAVAVKNAFVKVSIPAIAVMSKEVE